MIQPKLTKDDLLVLAIIKRRSTENRILAKDVIRQTGQTYTQFKHSVKRLRKNGIPIGATKAEPMGYWLAGTKEEIAESNRLYEAQAKSMLDTVATMNRARLNTWEIDLNNPGWRGRNTGLLEVEYNGKKYIVSAELDGDDTVNGSISFPPELQKELSGANRILMVNKASLTKKISLVKKVQAYE